MNISLEKRIEEFTRKRIVYSFLTLIFIMGLSMVLNSIFMKGIASQSTQLLSRIVQVNDFREVSLILEQGHLNGFSRISYESNIPGENIVIPPPGIESSGIRSLMSLFLEESFKTDVHDPLALSSNARVTYWFSRFGFLSESVLFWLLAMLTAIPQQRMLKKQIQERHRREIESERVAVEGKAILEISRQVAHDIRSPLSALLMVVGSLTDSDSAKNNLIRNAVNRINGIANDLLKKSQARAGISNATVEIEYADDRLRRFFDFGSLKSDGADRQTSVDLVQLADAILSEKRITNINPAIEIIFDSGLVFGFVKAENSQIGRIISNLINNSIEALDGRAGKITVALRSARNKIQLIVQDNGRGIPPEILKKIGSAPGVSYGKQGSESGSGLGVYHAKRYVESIGGQLSIMSQVGSGTIVDIQFQMVSPPFPITVFTNAKTPLHESQPNYF